ncbi:MAG: hypothetical protein MJ247_08065 [Alphaproteobacteria bacterium]|nr:hypothetical protein [Alphaproteobacteria bacterium]
MSWLDDAFEATKKSEKNVAAESNLRDKWIRDSKLKFENATDREIEKAVDAALEKFTNDDDIKKYLEQQLDF